jgi:hypothetical protein
MLGMCNKATATTIWWLQSGVGNSSWIQGAPGYNWLLSAALVNLRQHNCCRQAD